MMQLATTVEVDLDSNQAYFTGVEFGANIELLRRSKSAMDVIDYNGDVLVFFVPSHRYFAARWTRGRMPAHYMVFTYAEDEPVYGTRRMRYTGLTHLANIPVRRGAVQS